MVTQVHVHPGQMRFGGLRAAPEDRTRAFRAARRHSFFVGLLKLALPLGALGVAGLYVLPSLLVNQILPPQASVEKINLDGGELKMMNPRYNGVHDKYGTYDIRADSGLQKISAPEVMNFQKINAELVNPQGEKTTLTAPSGIFHSKKGEMTFDNGVTIGGEAGLAGKLKTATAYMKENRLISERPVDLSYHGHNIKANSLEVWTSESRAIFTGNVRVHLERAQTEGKQQ
jgi:lipopolysaccharide export system protein LptC